MAAPSGQGKNHTICSTLTLQLQLVMDGSKPQWIWLARMKEGKVGSNSYNDLTKIQIQYRVEPLYQ
jgi:hypothetical protein